MALRFDSKRPPRNFLGRGEQRRILLLVMLLGGVVIAMYEVAKPETRVRISHWLSGGGDAAQRADHGKTAIKQQKEIDTRVPQRPATPRDEGVIRIQQQRKLPVVDVDPLDRYFPGVKPAYLDDVRDNSFPRSEEHEAMFHLLDLLAQSRQQDLEQASRGPVTFRQLYEQPKQYRGELISIQGTVRRAYRCIAPKNAYGIEVYHELWLWPNNTNPVLVYCLDLPEEFPRNKLLPRDAPSGTRVENFKKIHEQVALTGFFFKRQSYLSAAKNSSTRVVRDAPLILVKSIAWSKRPPRKSTAPTTSDLLIAVAVAAGCAVGLTFWIWRRTHQSATLETYGIAARQPGKLDEMEGDLAGSDIGQTLRRMAKEE